MNARFISSFFSSFRAFLSLSSLLAVGCAHESQHDESSTITTFTDTYAVGTPVALTVGRGYSEDACTNSWVELDDTPCEEEPDRRVGVAIELVDATCSLPGCTATKAPGAGVGITVISPTPGTATVRVTTRSIASGEVATVSTTIQYAAVDKIVVEHRPDQSAGTSVAAVMPGAPQHWCASVASANGARLRIDPAALHFAGDKVALPIEPFEGTSAHVSEGTLNGACTTFSVQETTNIIVGYGSLSRTVRLRVINASEVTKLELVPEGPATYIADVDEDPYATREALTELQCACSGACKPKDHYGMMLRVTDSAGIGYLTPAAEHLSFVGTTGTIHGTYRTPHEPFFWVVDLTGSGTLTATFGSATLSIPIVVPTDCPVKE